MRGREAIVAGEECIDFAEVDRVVVIGVDEGFHVGDDFREVDLYSL